MNLIQYIFVVIIIFILGVIGIILNYKNILIMLMSIELMLLSINFNFIVYSVYLDDILGQIFSLLILTVAAAEAAIGLAILIVYYRIIGVILTDNINMLKG